MQWGKIFDIGMAIVAVAGATVAVSSPNTASIIKSFGDSFANSLKAAMGKFA